MQQKLPVFRHLWGPDALEERHPHCVNADDRVAAEREICELFLIVAREAALRCWQVNVVVAERNHVQRPCLGTGAGCYEDLALNGPAPLRLLSLILSPSILHPRRSLPPQAAEALGGFFLQPVENRLHMKLQERRSRSTPGVGIPANSTLQRFCIHATSAESYRSSIRRWGALRRETMPSASVAAKQASCPRWGRLGMVRHCAAHDALHWRRQTHF